MNKCNQARDPNTPPDILQTLATHEDYTVRYAVVRNKNTPESILRILAQDKVHDIRLIAAHHHNTSEIVKRLYLMTQDNIIKKLYN